MKTPLNIIINGAIDDKYIIKSTCDDNVYYFNNDIDDDSLEVFIWTLVKYNILLTRDLDGRATGFIIL